MVVPLNTRIFYLKNRPLFPLNNAYELFKIINVFATEKKKKKKKYVLLFSSIIISSRIIIFLEAPQSSLKT
jgi:hypothetical protein